MPASHTAKNHAVQQGVASQTVVAMDAAGHFPCGIQPRNGLARLSHHCGVLVNLQATHAVVDDWGDDR
eukprot:Skav220805  [mRNA]  locus=scaffold150:421858:422061:- [translate_table: standard]